MQSYIIIIILFSYRTYSTVKPYLWGDFTTLLSLCSKVSAAYQSMVLESESSVSESADGTADFLSFSGSPFSSASSTDICASPPQLRGKSPFYGFNLSTYTNWAFDLGDFRI